MAKMLNIESEILAQNVLEFYGTTSEVRRTELQKILDQFLESPYVWRISMNLVNSLNPTNVQFYGAKVLHHSISRHFNRIAENADDVSVLKDFYIQALTIGVGSLSHSVLNKLSSGLAVLVLKSLHDFWSQPIQELMLIWSNQLELLLRVIAEIAAEFHRLNVPLDQRNIVKTELNNMETNVVQLSQHVLDDVDSSASLRNAAIECIELWLKLPGANLDNYLGTFGAMFSNIGNDFHSFARILSTIKSIDGLSLMPKLVWQIAQFIACNICPRVQDELTSLLELTMNRQNPWENMDELVPLISAMAEFGHDFMHIILKIVCDNIDNQNVADTFISLCRFFFNISILPGLYPIDECLSELPEPWWCSLREHLLLSDDGTSSTAVRQRLRSECSKWYMEMLQTSIDKFTYVRDYLRRLDKEALERFETYRSDRNEVSVNAIQLDSNQTMQILAHSLERALDMFDPSRSEAILYMIIEAADFINDSHMSLLLPALRKFGPVDHWLSHDVIQSDGGFLLFVRTSLALLQTMDHLLYASPEGQALLPHIVHCVSSFLCLTDSSTSKPDIDVLALNTLTTMLKNRDSTIQTRTDVLDLIIQQCYEHFLHELRNSNSRLAAIRCVGIALSCKQPEYILTSLNQILAPRLIELDNLASNKELSAQQENRVLFELEILAQLVATLEPIRLNDGIQQSGTVVFSSVSASPVRLIIDQTLPLLNKLLSNNNQTPTAKLISTLCDVLKSAVHSLYVRCAPLLDTILNFVDVIIVEHSHPACELAKSLFLTFHKNRDETATKLVVHLAKWFAEGSDHLQQLRIDLIDADDKSEQLVNLGCYVIKKFWDNLLYVSTLTMWQTENENVCCRFVRCHCLCLSVLIQHSKNMSLVQNCLRSVQHLLKLCNTVDDCPALSNTIETVADHLAGSVFVRISNEVISGSINIVADILFALVSKYPDKIRATILPLSGGDSHKINALFSCPNKFNFRHTFNNMHQAALLHKDQ